VFESNFKEGQDLAPCPTCNGDQRAYQSLSIRVIPSPEPFEVLYPLLYYLYTDRVCFTTAPIGAAKSFYNVPSFDPEEAYRVGDLLDLDKLKERALDFLSSTSDESNIVSRVFGDYALDYEDIGKCYEKFFYQHWNSIRRKNGGKRYFKGLSDEADHGKSAKLLQRCLDLMEGLDSKGYRSY
jgi:hypothetical protein